MSDLIDRVAKDINVPCTDTISRQAAMDGTKKIPDLSVYAYCSFLDMLSKLPSVPERKKGRWVDCVGSDHWKCSECGDRAPMYWDANRQEYDEWFSPYCPHCGAKMEGAEDEL